MEAPSATTSLLDGDRTFMPKFNFASPFLVPVNKEKAPEMFKDVPDRLYCTRGPRPVLCRLVNRLLQKLMQTNHFSQMSQKT
jgi:hypothetical protein